jgi:prolipoprotein diacylglyceryltransferase
MSYGEIYIIANFINDKLYVGQTKKGIDVRWRSHIYHSNFSNCPRLNNKPMQDFFEKINKYKIEG